MAAISISARPSAQTVDGQVPSTIAKHLQAMTFGAIIGATAALAILLAAEAIRLCGPLVDSALIVLRYSVAGF